MKHLFRKANWIVASIAVAIGGAGCGGGEPAVDTTTAMPAPQAPPATIDPAALASVKLPDGMTLNANAGVNVATLVDTDGELLRSAALASNYPARNDPFALLQNEMRYERDQTVARIAGDGPLFNEYFEITPPPAEEGEITEPAPPNLRLAGIIMGDGVSALLEFNGQIIEIRPGTRIPNSEWVVASIDTERAILRRGGNKRPKELIVYLSGKMGGAGGGGQGGQGGNPSGPSDDGGGRANPGAPGRAGRGPGSGGGNSNAANE